MKKFFTVIIFIFLIAGCTTQKKTGASKYIGKHNHKQVSFQERVFEKFKRKPLSERRKYHRRLRKNCYVVNTKPIYNNFLYKPINNSVGVYKNSDCWVYTYGK
jgi:hypothetical protein